MLQLIAAFKLLKALVLVGCGIAAMELLNPVHAADAQVWLQTLMLDSGHHLASQTAQQVLSYLDFTPARQLREIAFGAYLYALVFLVEGIGLARRRRWAEYLTIAVTASLLPFEVVALSKLFTWVRLGALLLNVAVLAYLVGRLRARVILNRGVAPRLRFSA